MNPLRAVFMGSPAFALPTLRALHQHYSVIGVVTQPDKEAGRGNKLTPPPVKLLALELGIDLLQPKRLRDPEALTQLTAWHPDLIIVAAFGQILKPDVLTLPRYGCVNVHASLLPRWRGAAPINAAILHGDDRAGVTIMKMDEGVDTGDMIASRSIPIEPTDTGGSLTTKLSHLGAELLIETLPRYLGGDLIPQSQPTDGITYAGMIKKEDALIDFNHPAEAIARKVRAYNPNPGAYFLFNGAPLKVYVTHAETGSVESGKLIVHNKQPAIGTSLGILVLDEIQPAGKKPMNGKAFLAGARNWGS
jgi:methionyl-tRNA formyltransferase